MKIYNNTEPLLLAADSGGSKTDWRYLNRRGETVKKVLTPGMASLHSGVLPVMEYAGEARAALNDAVIDRIYFSLGGPNGQEVQEALQKFWPGAEVTVEREASGDLAASCMEFLQCSAVVMGGTGVAAMGFNPDGSRNFAEGWGPVLGDYGSGGSIGLQAVQIFLQGVDKTASAGRLPELFSELFIGLDISKFAERMEFKARVNALSRKDLAALAPRVMQLAAEGDAAAGGIIERSAAYMAALAAAVTPADGAVLMLGGLFKLGEAYRDLCRQQLAKLRPDCRWQWDVRCNIGNMAAAKVLMMAGIKVDSTLWEKIANE